MMASTSEVPLQLFFEQSSLFCSSVKNDLDQCIGGIENAFSSINRNVKIAPKQCRKNRLVDTPDSCTLDLKEFTKSKQNALHNLRTTFEAMELKWSNDIAELKDWFLRKVEDCLSKIQLEIKVSAEDLNLSKTVHEVEENSSSDSEIEILADHQNTHRFHATSPSAAGVYYNDSEQNRCLYHASSSPAGNSNTSDFQRNINGFRATSPFPTIINKSGKKEASDRAKARKGIKATQLSKKDIAKGENSSSDSEMDVSDQQNTHMVCSTSPPASSIYQTAYQQSKSLFHASSPPAAYSNTSNFPQNTSVLRATSPSPAVINSSGKKATMSRVQTRKKTKATQLSKDIAIEENSNSDSETDVSVHQQNTCRIRASSPPASNINTSVLQQNTSVLHAITNPPDLSMKKGGNRGTMSRAKTGKGTKPTCLNMKEIAKEASFLSSSVTEPVMKSKMSDWQSLVSAVETAPCKPGLCEIKVWRAKKPAYIGHSNDLQKSISLYRDGQPSGEKHLDLFIQRNKDEVSVRFAIYPSVQLAKLEQKKRLKEFLEKHKNLPSYNYGV